jgi:hypothetical protein
LIRSTKLNPDCSGNASFSAFRWIYLRSLEGENQRRKPVKSYGQWIGCVILQQAILQGKISWIRCNSAWCNRNYWTTLTRL